MKQSDKPKTIVLLSPIEELPYDLPEDTVRPVFFGYSGDPIGYSYIRSVPEPEPDTHRRQTLVLIIQSSKLTPEARAALVGFYSDPHVSVGGHCYESH